MVYNYATCGYFFRQRTVTRGVNKGVKEDFKLTMVKQVSRSEEPVEKLIRTFLTNERISILKALAWDKMSYLSIIVIIAPTVNFVEYTIIQNLCIFWWGGGLAFVCKSIWTIKVWFHL